MPSLPASPPPSSAGATFTVLNPATGAPVVERPFAPPAEVDRVLDRAAAGRRSWAGRPLAERIQAVTAFVDAFLAGRAAAAEELTAQIGRPCRWAPGEVGGFEQRARHMLSIAPEALADTTPAAVDGFERTIRHVPHGVVLVLSPWNYPLLTAVNAIVPALVAGNVVILKHSDQTPLCAERFTAAGAAAGLPPGVLQHVHASHPAVAGMVADDRVDHVCFTGSVGGGRAVQAAAAHRFIGVGLELGGKDAAYVRPDADLDFTCPNVLEGAFFNSGQSCCGLERLYVHDAVYDDVVARLAAGIADWSPGDPTDPTTAMGPVVRLRNAQSIRAQVDAALAAGARDLVAPATADDPTTAFVQPRVLIDVDHRMEVMREETFGPVLGVMRVRSDAEAIAHINDSAFGLTASIWSTDTEAAHRLAPALDVGTVFLNRCDYLDPALAWVGVKASGRGVTLSTLGFGALTRPQSLHFRLRA